jgi:hypothetical protein
MAGQILTVVSATVEPAREADLAAAYRAVIQGQDLPDGLLASALLRGEECHWQIATLWRDRQALDTMRSRPEAPAAPRVFQQVGAQPTLTVFEVAEAIQRAP